ncbi:hypothetical protein LPJ61_005737, partial [Coemansia biformis]
MPVMVDNTIKVPLLSVWQGTEEHFRNVQHLILKVHFLTLHTFQLTRWIFVHKFNNASVSSSYAGKQILTAYKANVVLQFSGYLQYVVNHLLGMRRAKAALHRAMAGASQADFQQACHERIWLLVAQVKAAIMARNVDVSSLTPEAWVVVDRLSPVLQSYVSDYCFSENNIYKDMRMEPLSHFKAFCALDKLLRSMKAKGFQCFPQQSSWIPGHVHIHTKVLCEQIIGRKYSSAVSAQNVWSEIVNTDGKAFRARNKRFFWDTIMTDGISLSIIKKT